MGTCSNNYAEYSAFILAQLFNALLGITSATIKADSQLMIEQIKGNYKVKNIRLVELIKMVHHLTFKFLDLHCDWIDRKQNTVADLFSKYGAKPRLTSEKDDVFRVFFSL